MNTSVAKLISCCCLALFLFAAKAIAQPASCTAAIGTPANGAAHHLTVTWAAVGGATSYELENSTNGSTWANIYTGASTTYDHNTGALGNATQYYRVRSISGTASAYTNATQYPIYTACDAPAVPQLSNAGTSGMSLALVPESPDPNPSITTYSIYCSTTSQYVQANGTLGASEVFQTMATWGTVNITGLAASTNYCFYAKAKNNDGDVRTASGSPISTAETFTTNANFSTQSGSGPTNRFWSPSSCTTGGLTYSAANGCTGGYVGFSGSFNNFYGCFLRTPQQNCTGNSSIVINFDLSNSYIASHLVTSPSNSDAIRFYMWVDNGFKQASSIKIGGVEKGVSDINGLWLKFDELRTCVNVDVTFDLTTSSNLSNILFYLEPNCSFNDGQVFSVKLDNISVLSEAASTACLSTTTCTAATIQTHPSNETPCVNGNATFSIVAGGSVASYLWQESTNGGGNWNPVSNGGIYSNATTASLTLTGVTSGMNGYLYRCNVTGSCSGNPTSNAASLTVNIAPGVAGTVSGSASVCQGQSGVTYSVSAVSGATSYAWSLPTGAVISAGDGTSSITVTFSGSATAGDITVTPSNTCGQGTASSAFAVSVNQLAAQPAAISGSTSVCGGGSETYSIDAVNGATSYTWTLPNGWTGSSSTETITATTNGAGGTISVTANNTCGSSSAQTLLISAASSPSTPGTINGPDSVCAGSPLTLSIAAVNGADSYNWFLPVGWTGSSTTTSITVNVGNSSGSVSVSATNSCGTSSLRTQAFTANPLPSVVFDFSLNPLCNNDEPIVLSDGSPAGGVYAGNGVSNGSFFPKNVSVGNHTITYDYTDANGCSGSHTSVITVDECTGIDKQFAAGIHIYPNPFQDVIVIQSELSINTILVYDAMGKEILRKEFFNTLHTQITLPDLAKGIYSVRVISDENASMIRKMIRVE
ncbi:MAG: T9SS type A sorting domain-containing protein [Chitinophagales bacterium]|nr:T9SS type A sorting domain-containing protein [Chitinophagales bacterium]